MADRFAAALFGIALLAVAGFALAVPPPPPPPPPPPAFPSRPELIEDVCSGIAPVVASGREHYEFITRNTNHELLDAARGSASGHPVVRDIQGLDLVAPDYPVSLIGTGTKGKVLLEVQVSETGEVQDAIALCSDHAAFSGAALEAVKTSRFTPQRVNDIAVPTLVRIPYSF